MAAPSLRGGMPRSFLLNISFCDDAEANVVILIIWRVFKMMISAAGHIGV